MAEIQGALHISNVIGPFPNKDVYVSKIYKYRQVLPSTDYIA